MTMSQLPSQTNTETNQNESKTKYFKTIKTKLYLSMCELAVCPSSEPDGGSVSPTEPGNPPSRHQPTEERNSLSLITPPAFYLAAEGRLRLDVI